MPDVFIQNTTHPHIPPVTAKYCQSFACQLKGLSFQRTINPYEGLLLVQRSDSRFDSSIHMIGMNFDLCVAWINSEYEVVDVRLAKRWRPAYFSQKPARYVLETHVERMKDFSIGDHVEIKPVSLA